jgi:glycine dehydrogenase
VVVVACDPQGNVDLEDLRDKAERHASHLGALMLTYPSTHGVFERTVKEICGVVHDHGGQVYLDGANLNAQVGLCRPGDYGADVCHLNLHKTFAIPHGGGGPGVGPIAVAEHLARFLPGHPMYASGKDAIGPVSAAPFGSPNVLPISWAYIALKGAEGLTQASQLAILNANYLRRCVADHFPTLFVGEHGLVAHEFVADARGFKRSAGIEVDDIAKRLMDFGFHAPTMSWPVPGTLMIEPTESESKAELDRLCEALSIIRAEIRTVEQGQLAAADSPLRHAPHTAGAVTADEWGRAYSRQQAAFPTHHTRVHKYWPPVARIDNAWGDRNLITTRRPEDGD